MWTRLSYYDIIGIYFTLRTRFVQFRLFIESIRVVAQPGSDENGLSSFRAYSFFDESTTPLLVGVIPGMFSDIFSNAFDIRAIFGGFTGSCVLNGIKRGLFSNEAGVGSAPNAAALCLFAFTTLIGNFYYAEMGLKYLCGKTPGKALLNLFRVIAALIVLAGSVMEFGLVWSTADVLMGFMALINLPVILLLGGTAIRCMKDYMEQKKEGKDPIFKAADIGLKDKTDFWN